MKKASRCKPFSLPPALGVLMAAGLVPSSHASDAARNGQENEDPQPTSRISESRLFGRTSVLWSNSDWKVFRESWRKIGEYYPDQGDYSQSSMDQETVNQLRERIYSSIAGLRGSADQLGLDSLEIDLLQRLAIDRLQYLSFGSMLPMTRMMPPPVSDQTDGLVPVIEARIDAIISLRENGLISGSEMTEAFTDLREAMDAYFLLETISDRTGYNSSLWMVSWPEEVDSIPAYMESLRTSLLETPPLYADSAGDYEMTVNRELDELEVAFQKTLSRLPAIHELIISLELL